ncbi:hypothetical protein GGH94_002249 [Coemansia aciculifera]|uniref:Uncharacterized protein n=2 Tax=Coemansia TaxID=4863 RepID=A0A9W8IJ97_9FUNG|nr:hypothetical protein GGH94_002249 [Coemansia aciculifera]
MAQARHAINDDDASEHTKPAMDSHSDLVDVLLLSDYNIYERFPELVQRVDYFLYEWSEEMLTRTESLLRKKSRSVRNIETNKERLYTNNGEDEAFTHARSLNIAWRQFAVGRLQLPRYPPERINWNKDADPVFLYGQMPALRLEIPWSTHSSMTTLSRARNCSGAAVDAGTPPAVAMPGCALLKPALKRTDLQTFLTSPTLSPASSPPYSPMDSPTISIRESMSTSSFGSDATLDNESSAIAAQLKPRLRFNDSVEQCMVVFKQEKEYLPTDYEEEDSADENDTSYYRYSSSGCGSSNSKRAPLAARRSHGSSSSKSCSRNRRTLVIKLAPAHLKGDHRKLVAVSAPAASTSSPSAYREYVYAADSDDDDVADYFDTYSGRHSLRSEGSGSPAAKLSVSGTSGGVSGYVQGCVQSVAGQVRRFVSDAVSVSTFGADRAKSQPLPSDYVSDPFASHLKHSSRSSSAPVVSTQSLSGSDGDGTRQTVAAEHNVVRDPFSSAPPSSNPTMSADHMLFDDDEDAIIQEFEREMQKYGPSVAATDAAAPDATPSLFKRYDYANDNNCAAVVAPGHSAWDDDEACDYDMYDSEYQLHCDDYSDTQRPGLQQHCRSSTAYHTSGSLLRDNLPRAAMVGGLAASDKVINGGAGAVQPQVHRGRSDSIIDRAEDTIVNTVDAVKWCASFISNYTIF